jgi:hypothetical protein
MPITAVTIRGRVTAHSETFESVGAVEKRVALFGDCLVDFGPEWNAYELERSLVGDIEPHGREVDIFTLLSHAEMGRCWCGIEVLAEVGAKVGGEASVLVLEGVVVSRAGAFVHGVASLNCLFFSYCIFFFPLLIKIPG